MRKEARTLLKEVLLQHLEQEVSQVPAKQEIRKQHSFSEKFEQNMDKLINEQDRVISMEKKKKIKSHRRLFMQVAAACLAIVVVFGGGYAALSSWRAGSSQSYGSADSKNSYSGGAYDTAMAQDVMTEERETEEAAEEPAEMETPAGGISESASITESGAEDISDTSAAKAEQKLIYTIHMNLETTEYDALLTSIRAKVDELGGYIQSSEVIGTEERNNRSISMTIRISAEKRNELTETVKTEASVTYSSETAQDVTLEYVDTQARITSLRTEQKTLLGLLEKAEDINTVLAIQNQLTEVRYQLESYESQLKMLDNKVNYSTFYLSIDEVQRVTLPEEGSFFTKLQERFTNSLYALGEGAQSFLLFVLGDFPILLVTALVIAVLILLIRKVIRKKKGYVGRDTSKEEKQDEA